MTEILRLVIVVFMAIVSLVANVQTTSFARATHYTKEDLEVAVHDASLQLDYTNLGQGKIVFDQNKAKDTFKTTLERNTGMTSKDYSLVDFIVYDDSTTSFPVTYSSTKTKFTDTFDSPSILAVIQTNSKSYFLGSESRTIKQVASYSYNLK